MPRKSEHGKKGGKIILLTSLGRECFGRGGGKGTTSTDLSDRQGRGLWRSREGEMFREGAGLKARVTEREDIVTART